jgi:hypothetical protein
VSRYSQQALSRDQFAALPNHFTVSKARLSVDAACAQPMKHLDPESNELATVPFAFSVPASFALAASPSLAPGQFRDALSGSQVDSVSET